MSLVETQASRYVGDIIINQHICVMVEKLSELQNNAECVIRKLTVLTQRYQMVFVILKNLKK